MTTSPSLTPNPTTVRLLRERLGMTRPALAEKAGFTLRQMRYVEEDTRTLRTSDMTILAHALGVTPSMLTRGRVSIDELGDTFATVEPVIKRARTVRAWANLAADAAADVLTLTNMLPRQRPEPVPERIALAGARMAAQHFRRHWPERLPIPHLEELAEDYGCILLSQTPNTRGRPAYTLTTPGRADGRPVIFIDTTLPGRQQRFALARELGRIACPDFTDHVRGDGEPDTRLDSFALELLAPQLGVGSALNDLTPTAGFANVIAMQQGWGVDAWRLLRRARDMGLLTDDQYTTWRRRLDEHDHVTRLFPDPPLAFDTINLALRDVWNMDWSPARLAAHVNLPERDLYQCLPGWPRPQ